MRCGSRFLGHFNAKYDMESKTIVFLFTERLSNKLCCGHKQKEAMS
jgi:hypothetical protein